MVEKAASRRVPLSERVRPGSEVALYVWEEIKALEAALMAQQARVEKAEFSEDDDASNEETLCAMLDEIREELGIAKERSGSEDRMAPVQGFSAGIPWKLHLRAWDAYRARGCYGQSAEDIARRGGFGTEELDMFVPGWREDVLMMDREGMERLKADNERLMADRAWLQQVAVHDAGHDEDCPVVHAASVDCCGGVPCKGLWRNCAESAIERAKEAEAANERDRSRVAETVAALTAVLRGCEWLCEGRGPYDRDDERYQQEFGRAHAALTEALDPLRRIAADWSDCPPTHLEIAEARKLNAELRAERDAVRAQLKVAEQELDRLREHRFPIMGGPSIPWRMILPHEGQALRNHGEQSLERLASRGGLSPDEALAVLDDRSWWESMWRGRTAHDELERRRNAFEDDIRAGRAERKE
jgi:hypothetical protein